MSRVRELLDEDRLRTSRQIADVLNSEFGDTVKAVDHTTVYRWINGAEHRASE
jgi:hypothetical protein